MIAPTNGHSSQPIRPLHVSATYVAVGLIWIFGSDTAMHAWHQWQSKDYDSDVLKGSLFVIASGVLVYLLSSRLVRSTDAWRRRAEEAAARLEAAVQASEQIVYAYDVQADRFDLTASPRSFLGIEPGAVVSLEDWTRLIHPEDLARIDPAFRRAHTRGEDYQSEYRIRRADGTYAYALERGKCAERNERGEAVRFVGLITDVSQIRSEQAQARAAIERSELKYRSLFENSPAAIVLADEEGRYLDVNEAACRLLGASREEILTRSVGELRAADGDPTSAEVYAQYRRTGSLSGRHQYLDFSGNHREVDFVAHRLPDGVHLWIFTDASSFAREEAFRQEQTRVLEMLAGTTPLRTAVDEIIRSVERLEPGVTGSILILRDDGQTVGEVYAPAMPDEVNQKLVGLRIGPATGSCGTAMYRAERVIVEDIATDPLWENFRELALPLGLRACWSEPIHLPSGKVVGSFAMYHKNPSAPDRLQIDLISSCAHLVGLAIHRDQAERALRREHALFSGGPAMVVRWSREPGWPILDASENIRQLGYDPEQLRTGAVRWLDLIHPDDVGRVRREIAEIREHGQDRHPAQRYRIKAGDGSYRDILDITITTRDERGGIASIDGYLLDISEHARTLRMLATIESRYQNLYERTPVMMQSMDPSRRLVSVSDRWLRELGSAREEVVGRLATDLMTPESARHANETKIPEFMRTGELNNVAYQFVRKDGSLVDVLLSATAEYDEGGQFVCSCSVMIDVTTMLRSMQDLRESQRRAQNILEGANAIFWEADPSTSQFTFASGRVRELLGYEPEEMLAPGFWPAMVHPEDRDKAVEFCRGESIAGRSHELEYRALRKDGSTVWLRDMVSVEVVDGVPTRLSGVLLDISAAKLAEKALRDSEERYRRTFHESRAVQIMVEPTTRRFVDANQAACDFYGYPRERFLTLALDDINTDPGPGLAQRVRDAMTGPRHFEIKHRLADGAVRDMEVFVTPIEVQGRPMLCSILHDVSERRSAERRQQLMLAELDHRVKNNLATIMSLAEQSGRNASSFDQFQRSFIGRVRALARMHANLASSRLQGASLDSIVRQTLAAFAGRESDCRVDGPVMLIVPRQAQSLTLALHELATNASKYGSLSRAGGGVSVRWTTHELPEAQDSIGVELEWVESGGPEVVPPTRIGFGTELVQGMIAHELAGHVEFHFPPEGLRCVLRFQLDTSNPDPEGLEGVGLGPASSRA